MNARRNRHTEGLTLVEVVIALMVIAVLVAIAIPYLRERERARLQALADVDPANVFTIRAWAVKDRSMRDEYVAVFCEIRNPTKHRLAFNWEAFAFNPNWEGAVSDPFQKPGEFELQWWPVSFSALEDVPGQQLAPHRHAIASRSTVIFRLKPDKSFGPWAAVTSAVFPGLKVELTVPASEEIEWLTRAETGRFDVIAVKNYAPAAASSLTGAVQ